MQITIQLASLPDRENLVAELWYGDEQWGEVSRETEKLKLELYPKPSGESGKAWTFELDEVLEKLQEARTRLTGETFSI